MKRVLVKFEGFTKDGATTHPIVTECWDDNETIEYHIGNNMNMIRKAYPHVVRIKIDIAFPVDPKS